MKRPFDNPFTSRRIDGLSYRFRGADIDDLVAALAAHGGRGAVVGPHGSGKTTLLDGLVGRLDGTIVRIRLSSETAHPNAVIRELLPETVGNRHAIFLDGAEQLGTWSWWRFHRQVRAAETIVITSHRPGRLPTIHECRTDVQVLTDLVEELAPDGVDADLDDLFHRHQGNIRLCFRELYDEWARR